MRTVAVLALLIAYPAAGLLALMYMATVLVILVALYFPTQMVFRLDQGVRLFVTA